QAEDGIRDRNVTGVQTCALPISSTRASALTRTWTASSTRSRACSREDKELTMAKFIDLNADMGESYGRWTLGADEEIMPNITSANVACGFHGGDPHVMRKTVELALRHGVAIGSHPSLPDLMGFGRRVMDVSPQELKDYLCYQTGALREFVRATGGELQHTKPHGILYSMIEKDEPLATAVAESARESGRDLILMALASGKYDRTARKMGVRVASEGFADRAYNVDLTLVSRKLPGSLITD